MKLTIVESKFELLSLIDEGGFVDAIFVTGNHYGPNANIATNMEKADF